MNSSLYRVTATIVVSNVYIKEGDIKVTGDIALMKGWFIAERILGTGRLVVWTDNNCSADPTIESKQNELMVGKPTEEATTGLTVKASPNPSSNYFTLNIQSSRSETVMLRITDVSGRVVTVQSGIAPNSVIRTGNELKAGMYFAELIQGKDKQVIKLIKL